MVSILIGSGRKGNPHRTPDGESKMPSPACCLSFTPETALGKMCHDPGPLTNLHLEIVEGVLIDVLHLLHEPHGIVGEGSDVGAAHLVIGAGVQPRGSHVGATNCLDLLQLPEALLTDDLDSAGDLAVKAERPDPALPQDSFLLCSGPLPHFPVSILLSSK